MVKNITKVIEFEFHYGLFIIFYMDISKSTQEALEYLDKKRKIYY